MSLMTKAFNFDDYFHKYENNKAYQEELEKIIISRYPNASIEWFKEKEIQKKGIDFKIINNFQEISCDLKLITPAKNHRYLENISLELVSDYDLWVNTKGVHGRSWARKADSQTNAICYAWISDLYNKTLQTKIILIYYSSLSHFIDNFFPRDKLHDFLAQPQINILIKNADSGSSMIGKFHKFKLWSHRNEKIQTQSFYYTITTPLWLPSLKEYFGKKGLTQITLLEKKNKKRNRSELKLREIL